MTIRAKLTLWYTGVFCVSLIILGFLFYDESILEPARKRRHQEGMAMIRDLAREILKCAVPVVLIGLGGGWWLMRKTMAPVAAITNAGKEISETNLKVRLPRSGNGDELDRLTEVFNSMIARLDESFSRIREFTLRASHELKTPLTIIRGEIETALNEGSLSDSQRERLLSELDEIDRLAKIVDGLTTLTKADSGLIKLQEEPVRLNELVEDIYADGLVLARPSQVEITLGQCEPVTLSGDNYRLRQVLLNLVDNAVKHNRPGGTVALSLVTRGGVVELTVSNTGPGISPEMLPRLFDPFFRGDAAQSRSVEGCGLGLAIVRWIVLAHHGEITLNSQPGGLTTATLRLPIRA